jgi:mannitol/fructose-specific phosphotransferase system IIA component (Ntr-type)
MKLKDLLKAKNIRLNVPDHTEGKKKDGYQVIREMANILREGYDLTEIQLDEVVEAVIYRERRKPTGMERNVAIPHGKTEHVQGILVSFATYPGGINFECMDAKPATLIICMVVDIEYSSEMIQALAAFLRILQREDVAQEIFECTDPVEAERILRREAEEVYPDNLMK